MEFLDSIHEFTTLRKDGRAQLHVDWAAAVTAAEHSEHKPRNFWRRIEATATLRYPAVVVQLTSGERFGMHVAFEQCSHRHCCDAVRHFLLTHFPNRVESAIDVSASLFVSEGAYVKGADPEEKLVATLRPDGQIVLNHESTTPAACC